jgi:Fe-S cluster assembly protein SufD
VLANPIHVLYITTQHESPIATFPRTLVIAGRNSQATVIESHVGFGGGTYFSCPVTEVVARDGANVHVVKIEDESARAYHVAVLHSYQERSSGVTLHNVQLGGALSRNDVHAVLGDEGAEARLDGLYLASDERLVDNHTTIEHAKPHCASRELYKGILDGAARAVFNGRIIVRKDAQKTDSKQTNRNLLLSEDATVFTNPQLEIFADDVRCTHGATIGHLDDEALFYMRSRGLSKEMAGSLLIYAFASEIIDRIPFEPARIRLERALFARLASGHMNGDPTA